MIYDVRFAAFLLAEARAIAKAAGIEANASRRDIPPERRVGLRRSCRITITTPRRTTMQAERPEKLIDPVCGMTVDVAKAEAAGLLLEYEGRTFAFCRDGCRRAFVESPAEYVAQAEAAATAPAPAKGLPVIDEGMRRWYESCSCCLSDAYPDIKAALDAEKAAASQPIPEGICEIAEAAEAAPAPFETHAH